MSTLQNLSYSDPTAHHVHRPDAFSSRPSAAVSTGCSSQQHGSGRLQLIWTDVFCFLLPYPRHPATSFASFMSKQLQLNMLLNMLPEADGHLVIYWLWTVAQSGLICVYFPHTDVTTVHFESWLCSCMHWYNTTFLCPLFNVHSMPKCCASN